MLKLNIKIQHSNSILKSNIKIQYLIFKFNIQIQYSNPILRIQYSIFNIQHSTRLCQIDTH